ncbi:MAG TPA: indole-3-glycerol-phosphate synthase [Steroidobacteraceae bacterium]|nr:indole-3-glycerol-phosphate synthase [Steroidobacteraceae bacterium]
MSASFLDTMAAGSRERVARARAQLSDTALRERCQALPAPSPLRLSPARFDLIAELKLRSPAAGQLARGADDLADRVQTYATAGAAAVSVLTEPSRFDGTLEHLLRAARALQSAQVPAMRKDFLVDPYQVLEARAAGAGGVLIIVRMLSDEDCSRLIHCAQQQGLFALIETFNETDIARARALLAQHRSAQLLLGVNCRDLATLEVVPGRLEQLVALLPGDVPRVAESGVGGARDAARVAAAGYDLALVGSALMTGGNPHRLVGEMLTAGRAARGAP